MRPKDWDIRSDEQAKTTQLVVKGRVVAKADLVNGTVLVEAGTYPTSIMNRFMGNVALQATKLCNHGWSGWSNNQTKAGNLVEVRVCVDCHKTEIRPRQ